MKVYSVNLDLEERAKDVYRLTANAAKERGDDDHVATEDNAEMVNRLFAAAMPMLKMAFGRYFVSSEQGKIEYGMPENWFADEAAVAECCAEFLANYGVAKWFELSGGTGERFIQAANDALEALNLALYKRVKPIR